MRDPLLSSEPTSLSKLSSHIPALDGLRGCAILLVLLTHVNGAFGDAYAGHSIDRWLSLTLAAGWIGVDLFFVLSGFLITRILLEAKTAPRGYFVNFYARRILRIFPLYYGFL